jgi:hypothetical protein
MGGDDEHEVSMIVDHLHEITFHHAIEVSLRIV